MRFTELSSIRRALLRYPELINQYGHKITFKNEHFDYGKYNNNKQQMFKDSWFPNAGKIKEANPKDERVVRVNNRQKPANKERCFIEKVER